MDPTEVTVRHHDDEVPVSAFSCDGRHDVVNIWNVPRARPGRPHVGHHLRLGKPSRFAQVRPKDRAQHHFISQREGLSDLLLKHVPTRGG